MIMAFTDLGYNYKVEKKSCGHAGTARKEGLEYGRSARKVW